MELAPQVLELQDLRVHRAQDPLDLQGQQELELKVHQAHLAMLALRVLQVTL